MPIARRSPFLFSPPGNVMHNLLKYNLLIIHVRKVECSYFQHPAACHTGPTRPSVRPSNRRWTTAPQPSRAKSPFSLHQCFTAMLRGSRKHCSKSGVLILPFTGKSDSNRKNRHISLTPVTVLLPGPLPLRRLSPFPD